MFSEEMVSLAHPLPSSVWISSQTSNLCCFSVTSNSNLSELARKLQQLGSSQSHSITSVHTAPPLTMPSHPSTPVSLAAQPTFSHDLNTQLAGVSPVFLKLFRTPVPVSVWTGSRSVGVQ